MKNYKKVILSLMLIICVLGSSFPVCASSPIFNSEPSDPSGVWYAPYGGTWNFTEDNGSNLILRPLKIVYITYDQLALLQANNLAASDLSTLATIARDQGVAAVTAWLTKKFGSSAAGKFIPYIGTAILAYDFFNAVKNYGTDARFAKAIAARHGIKEEYGVATYGGFYTSYEDWTSAYVYNPQGLRGTFTANNN